MIGMDNELKEMVLDYMEKGFLDNIIDMFKYDENLFPLIIDMIKDDRVRVRIGVIALVEEILKFNKGALVRLIPDIANLLNDRNPNIRGDSAYLLDIIGDKGALPYLMAAIDDEDKNVREIVRDAINNLNKIKIN